MTSNKHAGSNFDDFLAEENIQAEVEATALKRVIAFQLEQAMEKGNISKVELAERMKTSRSSLNRLLDPTNVSVTLQTLEKAALAIGKKLKVELA